VPPSLDRNHLAAMKVPESGRALNEHEQLVGQMAPTVRAAENAEAKRLRGRLVATDVGKDAPRSGYAERSGHWTSSGELRHESVRGPWNLQVEGVWTPPAEKSADQILIAGRCRNGTATGSSR
jgi:hypothetical protein